MKLLLIWSLMFAIHANAQSDSRPARGNYSGFNQPFSATYTLKDCTPDVDDDGNGIDTTLDISTYQFMPDSLAILGTPEIRQADIPLAEINGQMHSGVVGSCFIPGSGGGCWIPEHEKINRLSYTTVDGIYSEQYSCSGNWLEAHTCKPKFSHSVQLIVTSPESLTLKEVLGNKHQYECHYTKK